MEHRFRTAAANQEQICAGLDPVSWNLSNVGQCSVDAPITIIAIMNDRHVAHDEDASSASGVSGFKREGSVLCRRCRWKSSPKRVRPSRRSCRSMNRSGCSAAQEQGSATTIRPRAINDSDSVTRTSPSSVLQNRQPFSIRDSHKLLRRTRARPATASRPGRARCGCSSASTTRS